MEPVGDLVWGRGREVRGQQWWGRKGIDWSGSTTSRSGSGIRHNYSIVWWAEGERSERSYSAATTERGSSTRGREEVEDGAKRRWRRR
jgi:hypothetical protein